MDERRRRAPRAAHQLPAGRHGLSRSFVAENQRQRILAAVPDIVSLAGYAAMSVEDIIATAGVSRRTFYDHFKSKEAAFLASYEEAVSQLLAGVSRAYHANSTFTGRICDCLAAFLHFVAGEPSLADMCIVEVLAAGPQAVERRNLAMRAFVDIVQSAADELPEAPQSPALTAETMVGGIYEIVYARILRGEGQTLLALLPDLAYLLMLPYVGHQMAIATTEQIRRDPPAMPPRVGAADDAVAG